MKHYENVIMKTIVLKIGITLSYLHNVLNIKRKESLWRQIIQHTVGNFQAILQNFSFLFSIFL